ncbi:hypothetical protein C8Q80DRAFT_380752 [Daedaleopsis nitida]|nr:hypothetical protein C8Q80DRAFT_380752 [Daedaleopsis nitida]
MSASYKVPKMYDILPPYFSTSFLPARPRVTNSLNDRPYKAHKRNFKRLISTTSRLGSQTSKATSLKVADATESTHTIFNPRLATQALELQRTIRRTSAKLLVTCDQAAVVPHIGSITCSSSKKVSRDDIRTKTFDVEGDRTPTDENHDGLIVSLPVVSASLGSFMVSHGTRRTRQDPIPRANSVRVDVCDLRAAGDKRRMRHDLHEVYRQMKKVKLSHHRGILKPPGQRGHPKKHVRWCTSVVGEGVPVPLCAVVRTLRPAPVSARSSPSAYQKSGSERSNPLSSSQNAFVKTHRRSMPISSPAIFQTPCAKDCEVLFETSRKMPNTRSSATRAGG